MTKMPEKIYIEFPHPDDAEQYTHTQQLIEWLEGREKYTNFAEPSFFEGYNQAIDDFINHLRGTEDENIKEVLGE
jgi:hypothetical protein